MANTYNLGRIGLHISGAYSTTAEYMELDVVSYNGSSYIAKAEVPIGTLPNDTTYWALLAQGESQVTDIYPVGAIYMSVNSTSPALLFGGTWERIQDAFLLAAGAAYAAGATGGAAEVTLTVEQMPEHSHKLGINSKKLSGGSTYNKPHDYNAGDSGALGYESTHVGGGLPHDNMPPYLAVYVWKRTA